MKEIIKDLEPIEERKKLSMMFRGEECEFEIKKFGFVEKNQLLQQSNDVAVTEKGPAITFNLEKHRLLTLLYGLTSAPFVVKLSNLQKLEDSIGSALYNEIATYNRLDEKKSDSSATLSEEGPASSPSLGPDAK